MARKTKTPAKLCLGLTGRMASGKGEVIKILTRRGFQIISLSDAVREEAARRGGINRRDDMQDLGNLMRRQGGAGILGDRIRRQIENSDITRWVIDGIRNPAEIVALRQLPRFYLIGVQAEIPIILERLKKRALATDQADDDELRRRLAREWGEGEPGDGQRVGDCLAESDFTVANNSDLATLEKSIAAVLAAIGGADE